MRARLAAVALAVTITASLSAGCSSSTDHAAPGAGSTRAQAVTGSITVFAAASLTEAFTALGKAFEAAHPDTHVTFSFGASSTLALQVNQGAPADVFASASPKNMQQVVAAGGASSPADFAKNVMEIAVPPKNPAHISTVADLGRKGVKVALCQPQVPCGSTAAAVFGHAHVAVHAATLEQDVKSTLAKVELGEVDAGVVYVTDVRAAGAKVVGVSIPADVNASTSYPIAALRNAHNMATARAFVAFVLSAAGRSVLVADGFESP